jgi:hypothetical protein
MSYLTKEQLNKRINYLINRLENGKSFFHEVTKRHISNLKHMRDNYYRYKFKAYIWQIRKKIAQFIYPFEEE